MVADAGTHSQSGLRRCTGEPHPVDAGGLGDVMGALPKALARRGHRVMVVVPRYSNYEEGWETGVRTRLRVFGQDTEVWTHYQAA